MADKSVRVVLSASVGGYVAGMQKAARATDKMAAGFDSVTGSKGWATLERSAVAGGAAIAGVAALGVKTWMDFDQQMSAVASTGAEATNALGQLREMALGAGKDMGFTATESARGMEELLKAGVSVGEMAGALPGALSLAAAGEMDVGNASEIAATAMTQFKLAGKDVPHLADLLAAGAGKAQGGVEDLGMALKQGGLVASSMGLSIEETVGTLTAFASAGLLGSDAGTSFKTMLQRLANPSKEAAGTMADLGIHAYDAAGNFAGMESIAGQLRKSMQNLTPAQRDAAMATIFGSDAVRAANVLYAQGSKGIADWTKQVDSAGYASQVAAKRQDNLRGDLKKLWATLQETFIRQGDAVGGPLRSLTEDLTGLVALLGRHQGAVTVLAGIAAGLTGLAVAGIGLIKTVQTIRDLNATLRLVSGGMRKFMTSVDEAGVSRVDRLGKATGRLTVAAAGIGILAAAALAIGSALDKWEPRVKTVEAMENSLLGLSKVRLGVLSQDLSALDTAFQATNDSPFRNGNEIVQGVDSMSEALDRLLGYKTLGRDVNDAVGKLGDMTGLRVLQSDVKTLTEQFGLMDQALAKMDGPRAGAAFAQVAAEARKQQIPLKQVIDLFPQYQAKLLETANTLGVTNLSTSDMVDWMSGKLPPAIQKAAAAQGKLKQVTEATIGPQKDLTKEAKEQAEAFLNAANAAIEASGSLSGYEAAVDAAAKSVKDNGKTLDIDTEKGRANRAALDAQASAALSLAAAQAKNQESTIAVYKQAQVARAEFIKTATSMGMTREAASKLADEYGLIPDKLTTSVSAPGAPSAAKQVRDFDRDLKNLPPNVQTKILTLWNRGEYDAAIAALRAEQNKQYTNYINTVYRTTGRASSSGGNVSAHAATGGYITGPGTGTSDSILAALSNGEYVIRAASVARLGLARLDHINRYGQMPRFAQGGPVGQRYASGGAVSAPTQVQQINYITQADHPDLIAAALGRKLKAVVA